MIMRRISQGRLCDPVILESPHETQRSLEAAGRKQRPGLVRKAYLQQAEHGQELLMRQSGAWPGCRISTKAVLV